MFVVSMESIRGITLPRKTIKMLVKKKYKVVSVGKYRMVMMKGFCSSECPYFDNCETTLIPTTSGELTNLISECGKYPGLVPRRKKTKRGS